MYSKSLELALAEDVGSQDCQTRYGRAGPPCGILGMNLSKSFELDLSIIDVRPL